MTPLAEPLPLDPEGQGLFEYSLEDLESVGVVLAQEQRWLLDQVVSGGPAFALTIAVVIDPGDRYRMETPVYAYDVDTGQETIIPYPAIVELDWNEMLKPEVFNATLAKEANWARFPSLPGRIRRIGWYGDMDEGEFESWRIWNLWPISEADLDPIESAVIDWSMDSDSVYGMLDMWKALNWGDMEVCDFATCQGLGDEEDHTHEKGPYGWDNCLTGDEAFRAFEDDLFVKLPDGSYSVKAREGPDLLAPYEAIWEQLLLYSQTNAFRSVGAFPPWDRDDLIASERWYSPWLWLSS